MDKLIIIVTVPIVLETWLKGQSKFLSQFYEVEIITSYDKNIEKIQEYENVSIKIVDFNRKINLLKDIKVLITLFLYLVKKRPSIVYTLTPKAGLLGMISSWFARVPNRIHCVVGLPHLEAQGKRKNILIMTERLTYWFATKIYSNSFNLKKEIENKLTSKSVSVIGNGSVNGVDTEYFKNTFTQVEKDDILKQLKIDKNDFVICFVGRIVKDKGINELVKVFCRLQTKYENIKLLLIGDYEDELDPISSESAKSINSNKNISHIPFQEDIRKYLAITTLFVLPSYREGLPNVLIEAGSYGIPLVATDINGCNEIILDGENGVLVKKKDEEELYDSIEKFIVDKEYYSLIKSNVRKSIINRYSQKYFLNELHNEFIEIQKSSK